MFVDNTRKIICLSVPGTEIFFAENFFKSQFESNAIDVAFFNVRNRQEVDALFNSIPADTGDLEKITQIRDQSPPSPNTIDDLINGNFLTSPLSEYDVYGICIDPVLRTIKQIEFIESERKNAEYQTGLIVYQQLIDQEIANNRSTDLIEPPAIPDIKLSTLNNLEKSFSIGAYVNERLQFSASSQKHRKQVDWLTYQGQNINHIYKYENYMTLISDICAKYNIDPSLYDDAARLSHRKTDLTVNDVPLEIRNTIENYYAEDKALYDSL